MTFSLGETLIVMPAMNEEQVIGQVIDEVKDALPGVSVLVVNDGSQDATSAIARSRGVHVLDLPFNLGVGGAMRLGFRFAKENGFKVAVQLDSDGQHNPRNVPEMIACLHDSTASVGDLEGSGEALDAGADVVIGARFAGAGNYTVQGPRKWAMKMLSTVLSSAVGVRLTDTTSGFKAHGPKAIALFSVDYPAEYLGDTIEAIVIGYRSGLRFTQVPVAMRERAGGAPSHNPIKSAIYLGRAFVALAVAFMRPKKRIEL